MTAPTIRIDELPAGVDADRIVAFTGFGVRYWPRFAGDGDGFYCSANHGDGSAPCGDCRSRADVPPYSTDLGTAWLLVELMVRAGYRVVVESRAIGPWACRVIMHPGKPNERTFFLYGETPALAICRVFLQLKELEAATPQGVFL